MDIESLDLRNSVGKLRVKLGSDFRVEATNVSKRFRAEEKMAPFYRRILF